MRFARYFVAVLCVLICIMSTSCSIWNFGYEIQEREYYLNKNNFVPVTAVCVEIVTNEWFPGQYFINVKDMVYEETENCKFISVSFEVDKANSAILKDAKIDEKLTTGTRFTFISAPKYFGDGYQCPIVGLEVDGEILLDFDVGYKNLMATY